MNLLAECVNAMKKEDIKTYQSNLFTLFLEALDFRAHHDQEASVVKSRKSDVKLLGIMSKAETSLTPTKKSYSSVYDRYTSFFICFMDIIRKSKEKMISVFSHCVVAI